MAPKIIILFLFLKKCSFRAKVCTPLHNFLANVNCIKSIVIRQLLFLGRKVGKITFKSTSHADFGLVETPSRGKYRITDDGKKALASRKEINIKYLEKSEKFRAFHKTLTPNVSNLVDEEKDESPTEILDTAFQQITATLASQLMDEVMKLSSAQFEKLVVNLLLHMGYGNGITEAGMVTQQSNDGGIDGIIKEDQLGFSNIYIQAKQWATDQTAGKPEIQKFVGALQGQQAQKGLFITTAKFSSGALQYAANLLGTKVVLVDGLTLTRLMIKHNVGVSVEHVYEVKKVDNDFFSEGL